MTAAMKSSLILGATLLLGVMIGLVGQGTLQRTRLLGGPPPSRKDGFAAHMREVLQLREDQRATVLPILAATADANQQVIDAARRQLRVLVDSMAKAMAPLLDDAQRARLAERIQALPNPFPPPPDGRGPPPDGRGPPRDGRGPPPDGRGPPPGAPPPPETTDRETRRDSAETPPR